MCDYRRGLDWWMGLLTTYKCTLTISIYATQLTDTYRIESSVYCYPLAVPWQRILTQEL
jgi:hypothetical protein